MNYVKEYARFLNKFLKLKRPIKVIFDCSNGTTGLVLEKLFKKSNPIIHNSLFVILNKKPDGNFPAHGPNPMLKGAMNQLVREVKKQKADLGVAFDGDGDRVFFVDDRGRLIDPNESGYILMQVFKPPYIVGVVSSWRLKNIRRSDLQNIEKYYNQKPNMGTSDLQKVVYISRIGHTFAKQLMRKKKANLGLEHSGHYYFPFRFGKAAAYFDSGILGAIKVINFVSRLDADLANWLDELPQYYRSGEINFRVSDKGMIIDKIEKKYKKKTRKIIKLDGLTMEFNNYWFNVRPSNTEDLLRLNMEAVSQKLLRGKLKEIKKLVASC